METAENSNSNSNKREKKDDPNYVLFTIANEKRGECHFRVKKTVKIGKVIDLYYERHQVDKNALEFLINGDRAHPWLTLADLKLKNGDVIEAMDRVNGGARGGGGT